jgi:hypothetical protein
MKEVKDEKEWTAEGRCLEQKVEGKESMELLI